MGRFVFMMLDGVGVGALPDAADYGDTGSNTLGNLARVVDLELPFLQKSGLGNILPLTGVPPVAHPLAMVGRLAPHSAGKDTTVGHWEHMGLVTPVPFPTYPDGFPEEVLRPFRDLIGRGILGNYPASGTQIIDDLGAEHVANGFPIVYTSADSVFQIAAHVDVVPLAQLYEWCEIARRLLTGRHAVARVIARPFTGFAGAFTRTKDRRDFSLAPPAPIYLDLLAEAGIPIHAFGKINEIFTGRGISSSRKVASNDDNLAQVLDALHEVEQGLIFTNLVDFDMAWGHRNDVDGFAGGLAAVDCALPGILAALAPDDALLLSADHGVDPTTLSTDHSREYVPLLLYPRPPSARPACYEGDFADTGATIYAALTGRLPTLAGKSLLVQRPSRGWRQYPSVQAAPVEGGRRLLGRVGPSEAAEAAAWLQDRFGAAPELAVVLGSGLQDLFATGGPSAATDDVPYAAIPHWCASAVLGHPNTLLISEWEGQRLVALKGRLHGYEGFDLSEQQLHVRSLARWGVRRLVVTNACGAVDPGLEAGDIVLATEILDLQSAVPGGYPLKLEAAGAHLAEALQDSCAPASAPTTAQPSSAPPMLTTGVYAAVPGPQYETAAEIGLLRSLGVAVVGMSTAAEVRAAQDEGLQVAVLAVVTNPGATSGEHSGVPRDFEDQHRRVLASADLATDRVRRALSCVLEAWGDDAGRQSH